MNARDYTISKKWSEGDIQSYQHFWVVNGIVPTYEQAQEKFGKMSKDCYLEFLQEITEADPAEHHIHEGRPYLYNVHVVKQFIDTNQSVLCQNGGLDV